MVAWGVGAAIGVGTAVTGGSPCSGPRACLPHCLGRGNGTGIATAVTGRRDSLGWQARREAGKDLITRFPQLGPVLEGVI